MNAAQFNERYPVGSVFIHREHEDMSYGEVVRTVTLASDFAGGTIVEINVIPHFVTTDTLIPADHFG